MTTDRRTLLAAEASKAYALARRARALVAGGNVAGAFEEVLVHTTAATVAHREKIAALEDRIAQLERAAPRAKPRLRAVTRQAP